MPWGCGNPYGWCKHREEKKLGEWDQCIECSIKNAKFKAKIRKEHGDTCMCYICDDYYDNLGRQ